MELISASMGNFFYNIKANLVKDEVRLLGECIKSGQKIITGLQMTNWQELCTD